MEGAVTAFKNDLASLRTGRASANLLDPIMVDAYGSSMPITQVGTVSVPEARMISVSIWDKTLVVPLTARSANPISAFNPIVDGTTLRIPIPELNEERRKQLVKIAHQYAESAKVAARHVRRDGMEGAKKAEKDGDISQDDLRTATDRIQKLTDETISTIDSLLVEKESEIMHV